MKIRSKKIVAIGLAAVMTCSLAACGKSTDDSAKVEGEKKEVNIWVREQLDAPIKAVIEQYNE